MKFYGCNGNYQFVQYTEQGNFRGNCRYFQKRSPEGLVCNTNKYNYWNNYWNDYK